MMNDDFNKLILNSLSDILCEISDKLKKEGKSEDDIMKEINELDIKGLISDAYKEMSKFMVEKLQGCMHEYVMLQRKKSSDFIVSQDKKWEKCFVMSEALYYVTIEAVERYHKYIVDNHVYDNNQSGAYVYYVVRRLHARALQQFLEITYLTKCGFADGAIARWRSMYELCVVTSFIINNGGKVAKAYIEAANTDDNYEWARNAKCLKKCGYEYIRFRNVEKNCKFKTEGWKRLYILAHQSVHASPQGTMMRIGDNNAQRKVLLAGHSDYGIHIPAENAAISLVMMTNSFLKLNPYGEGLVLIHSMNKWVDMLTNCYEDTNTKIFGNEKIDNAK